MQGNITTSFKMFPFTIETIFIQILFLQSGIVSLSALHKYGLCTDQMEQNQVKTHFDHILIQIETHEQNTHTHTHAHTCTQNIQQISTHLFYQSSVAQVVYQLLTLRWGGEKRQKHTTCTKQRLNSKNSWGTFREFDSKIFESFNN